MAKDTAGLTSMALSEKESKRNTLSPSVSSKGPKYPWGLSLTLDQAALDKLGIKDLPKVGSYFTVTAHCCVTSTNASQSANDDEQMSMSLQAEEMKVEPTPTKKGQAIGRGYAKKKSGKNDSASEDY